MSPNVKPKSGKEYIDEIIQFTDHVNFWAVIIGYSLGFLSILTYCFLNFQEGGWKLIGLSLLIAVASMALGLVLGFLFGIPKTIQKLSKTESEKNTRYIINTNLEDISDWLTKIIVGVGLVEFNKIIQQFGKLHGTLKNELSNIPIQENGIYGISLIIFFFTFSFIVMYLYSRMNLSTVFFFKTKSEEDLMNQLEEKDPELAKKVKDTLSPSYSVSSDHDVTG